MKSVGAAIFMFCLAGPILVGAGGGGGGQSPKEIFAAHKGKVFAAEGGSGISCGVLLPQGYFLTTDSSVGTEGLVILRKDEVVYKLRPFWRNPVANMALLYPESVEGYQGMDQPIRPDYFVGAKQTLALPETPSVIPAGELLTAVGLPLFHLASKRVEGVCLGPEGMTENKFKRVRVDWPTPHGFLGSPVFNSRGVWVGVVSGVDHLDTSSDTPLGFVSDLGPLTEVGEKTWRDRVARLVGLHSNMPFVNVKAGAERLLSWQDFEQVACEMVAGGPSPLIFFEGNGETGQWSYKNKKIGPYVFYGDWMAGEHEPRRTDATAQLEVLLRGDTGAGLWLVLGGEGKTVAVERRKGSVRQELALADRPQVFPGTRVNLEVLCVGEKVGVYFMNMPLLVVEKCGFSKGGLGFHFKGRGRQTLGRFHITIPK